MGFTTDKIRSIAVVGHGATGKTSFVEQLLVAGKVISSPATVESGKTVSDYTPEEIENGMSIHTSLANFEWDGHKINVMDTPGAADFVGEVVAAFRAAESAVVVVGAKAGVQIETIKLWRRLNDRNLPRIVYVNKMDEDRASFATVLGDLEEKFDATFVPVSIPIGEAGDFAGVVDLINGKGFSAGGPGGPETEGDVPANMADQVEEFKLRLMEAAAEGDDELTMKYLEEETLGPDEIRRGIAQGLQNNKLVPVLCGSALKNGGVKALLDFLVWAGPSPATRTDTALDKDGNEVPFPVSADGSLAALNFKTTIDQFSGKLSFVKVMRGVLKPDSEFAIDRDGKKQKAGKLYAAVGKKLVDINELVAGDIGVISKIPTAQTNDTFHDPAEYVHFKPLQLPSPVYSLAISGASKKDEDKLGEQLQRTAEEDKTFKVRFDPETKESVIAGMGELHLNVILNRIKTGSKIEVETRTPKVAYRETIQGKAETSYRHKKQTGGHGQFGEVHIRIYPLERGAGYEFANEIKGGSVSKGYIPGIEKGLHEAMDAGIVAGYPAVDMGIVLFDGKEHPVDSSEMAFKLAARGAMKDAMNKAKPVILEPIMKLQVFIDDTYLGDVLSDLSSKRGRVLGQEQLGGGIIEIDAEVPQAELLRYSMDLRSITSGTGSFEMEFDHYAPATGKVADDIIAAAKQTEEVTT